MKRSLTFISLILMLMTGVLTGCGRRDPESAAERTASVTGVATLAVRPVAVDTTFEAAGVVRAKISTVISPKVVGTILAMRVREGDRVRTGQLLAELENREARAQLEKALAGLREAQGSTEELDRNLKAALAARVAADAGRRLAESTLRRYQTLRERRSVSDQEFDEVEARAQVAVAEVDRTEKMRQVLEARRQMVEARIGQAQAEVNAVQALVGYARITAPIDGLVIAKQVDTGSLATPGAPLLTIEGGGNFRLEVALEQSRIGAISPGMSAKVRFDPAGGAEGMELSGRVAEIVPAADPATRTFTVRIDLPSNSAIRSGQFARAVFSGGRREALLVPTAAVVAHGQLASVYVVDERGIARLRLITRGRTDGEQVEVLSGLQPEEKIVTVAALITREGVQIK